MNNLRYMIWCFLPVFAGCANLNSIYRTINVGEHAAGVALDAKQRAIFSTKRVETDKDGKTVTQSIICPEPSPDALAAYSASLGAADKDVQAAFAGSETAVSIGLRTQSIQLKRDELSANCYAYMNGAITADEFYSLQRRSQNFTLGLLAIEQLTGAVKADQVALASSAAAATGADDTSQEEADVAEAKKQQNDAK